VRGFIVSVWSVLGRTLAVFNYSAYEKTLCVSCSLRVLEHGRCCLHTPQDSRAFPPCARKSSAWLTSARSNTVWQTENGNVACWVFCFETLKDCACSSFALGWFWLRISTWDHIFLGVVRIPYLPWTPENNWELRKESRLSESMKLSNVKIVIHFVVFCMFHYITLFGWGFLIIERKCKYQTPVMINQLLIIQWNLPKPDPLYTGNLDKRKINFGTELFPM